MKFEIEITPEEIENAVIDSLAKLIVKDKLPDLKDEYRYDTSSLKRAVDEQWKKDLKKRPEEYQKFVENAIAKSIDASIKSQAGLLHKDIENALKKYKKGELQYE